VLRRENSYNGGAKGSPEICIQQGRTSVGSPVIPAEATGLAPVVIDSMMLFLQIHVIFIVVKSCNLKIETRQKTAP